MNDSRPVKDIIHLQYTCIVLSYKYTDIMLISTLRTPRLGKLELTGVNALFYSFFFALKHRLWELVKIASMIIQGVSKKYPQSMF